MMKIQELYYYTSSNTMLFILTKGNIFATNLKYMNDGEEYTNGLAELRMVLNEKYKASAEISEATLEAAILQQPKSYSISFSRERDLLSQWSMYAKESGVSLRMDFTRDDGNDKYMLSLNGTKEEKKFVNGFPRQVYYLTKHVMSESEYRKVCKKIFRDIEKGNTEVPVKMLDDISDGIDTVWRLLAPYVKRKEFFQEAEYRIVFALNSIEKGAGGSGSKEPGIRIDYRVQNSVLKPYLDVTRENGWPVKEIMIGPGFNQRTVFDSVRHFLDNADILVPDYSEKEFKENGLFFLNNLDKVNSLNKKQKLKELWKKKLRPGMSKSGLVESFNQFIDEQKESLWKQKRLLKHVYMSPKGIILSMSDTPYIY